MAPEAGLSAPHPIQKFFGPHGHALTDPHEYLKKESANQQDTNTCE